MIKVFKITHVYDSDASLKLAYYRGSISKDNKLLNYRFHYDMRKHYFSASIVNREREREFIDQVTHIVIQ